MVKKCIPCQVATPKSPREPLKMSPLPNGPWEQVSVDFCEVAGHYVLVVIDDYSRFPEIEILHSTAAKAVLPKLDRIFAVFGVPLVVKTDNGPPFNGREFAQFAEYLGFKHRKVSPLWPEANGEVERFMKTLGKAFRTSSHWKHDVYCVIALACYYTIHVRLMSRTCHAHVTPLLQRAPDILDFLIEGL